MIPFSPHLASTLAVIYGLLASGLILSGGLLSEDGYMVSCQLIDASEKQQDHTSSLIYRRVLLNNGNHSEK